MFVMRALESVTDYDRGRERERWRIVCRLTGPRIELNFVNRLYFVNRL